MSEEGFTAAYSRGVYDGKRNRAFSPGVTWYDASYAQGYSHGKGYAGCNDCKGVVRGFLFIGGMRRCSCVVEGK